MIMALAAQGDRCTLHGDCDRCKERDCIASEGECLRYYSQEEKLCAILYGRESVKEYYRREAHAEQYAQKEKVWTF